MEIEIKEDKLEITDSEGMSIRLTVDETAELVRYLKIKLE